MSRALVFGGYGTFGARVVEELARRGVAVTLAGRDRARAEAAARALGAPHRAVCADASRAESIAAVLPGHAVAVLCAGPFFAVGGALLDECLRAGVHYVDLGDDRAYAARVRGYDERFGARGLVAAYGCSSLPAISGALALLIRGDGAVERARVTLFIGNRNPKGAGAVGSAVQVIGRPIAAPQGTLRGFADAERVALPAPFGRRTVYNFDSPEYDLFPSLIGARAVAVKVGFELGAAGRGFQLLGRLGGDWGPRTARLLGGVGGLLSGLGSSGGVVMTELFAAGGRRWAALSSPDDGQRMAALPCALAAAYLCGKLPQVQRCGNLPRAGARTGYELLGPALLDELVAAGLVLSRG